VLSDLQGKPCSRGYQGAGGRHELVILAKHHVEAVALYPQPQRAAFPDVVGAAVVGGSVLPTPAPRGVSGGCTGSDPAPHRSPDPAPTRRGASEDKITR
jgi:hypothetical protein